MGHATRLERLFINEVSGVNDPANQSPGWALMKSTSAAELMEEVDLELAVGKAYGDVLEALASATKYLEGAPDEVLASVENIVKYIRDQIDAGDGSGETDEPSETDGATTKMWDRIRALRKGREDVKDEELKAELDARDEALRAHVSESLEAATESITKGVIEALKPAEETPEEKAAEAEAAEAEAVAKAKAEEAEAQSAAAEIIEAIGKTNEAVGAIADRLGKLEKGRQAAQSAAGQEDELEKGKGEGSELSAAFAKALSKPGGSLTLR